MVLYWYQMEQIETAKEATEQQDLEFFFHFLFYTVFHFNFVLFSYYSFVILAIFSYV